MCVQELEFGACTVVAWGHHEVEWDYNKSLSTVYKDVAKHTLEECQNLAILSCVQHPADDGDLSSTDTPSWVPAWHVNRVPLTMPLSKAFVPTPIPDLSFSIREDEALRCTGVCVDSILYTGSVIRTS